MFHRRFFKKVAACLSMAALLFASLAVAAYACPMMGSAQEANASVSVLTPASDSFDLSSPSLCQAHCQDGQQNVADNGPTVLPFIASFTATLHLDAPLPFHSAGSPPALLHATSPPLTIRHCCFRI
jgi:hypothetical protein